MAVAALVGCDGEVLSVVDAGFDVDAGFAHPRVDAGFEDAGFEDAGFPDAGPRCVAEPNPPIPWDCEDDVDWCDPEGDYAPNGVAIPSADLRAVWSRIEGDELVIELRFAAMPFRDDVGMGFGFVFLDSPPASGEITGIGDGDVGVLGDGVVWGVEAAIPFGFEFPPSFVGGGSGMPHDPCSVSLSLVAPVVAVRLPLALVRQDPAEVRFGITTTTNFGDHDASWSDCPGCDSTRGGPPQALSSGGGRADLSSDLVRMCDLTCADGGRVE